MTGKKRMLSHLQLARRNRPGLRMCENCEFFVPGAGVANVGECRRFPPGVFFNAAQGATGYSAGFSLVKPEQWCGEFKKGKKS